MTMDPHIATGRRVLALEAKAIEALAGSLDADFTRAVETILSAKGRVICTGMGKSGHVARKIAATLASTGTPSHFVHPAEASHGDLGMIVRQADVILALSKSGDTPELGDLVLFARHFENPLIAVTAVRNSVLANAASIRLIIPNAPEACAETSAPTTSTTVMMALGDALAVALLERRAFKSSDFRVFHPRGKLGSLLYRAGDLMNAGAALPLVRIGAALNEGLAEISAKGWGCVGVVDGEGSLIGMITDGDVRRLLASGARVALVDAAMTRAPVTTSADALAAAVLHAMNERKITQMFVVEGGRPIGFIHLHDLIRAGVA
ncbi:MAG: KpsF/GutQ family sugar-phosphate isomerase [Parvularculaceae bacterium]